MRRDNMYKKYYEKIINELINARMHFRLYKRLQEARNEYLDELNQAPGFFSFTIRAHGDAGLMSVARVLKKQRESITIWKFLDFVESNLELFSAESFTHRMNKDERYEDRVRWHRPVTLNDIETDKNKLDEFKQVIDNIITWRDKRGAHIDEKLALEQADNLKEFSIKLKELEDITEAIANILNRYSVAYDSSTYVVDMLGDYGVEVVLDAVRLDLKERRKRIEELRKQTTS